MVRGKQSPRPAAKSTPGITRTPRAGATGNQDADASRQAVSKDVSKDSKRLQMVSASADGVVDACAPSLPQHQGPCPPRSDGSSANDIAISALSGAGAAVATSATQATRKPRACTPRAALVKAEKRAERRAEIYQLQSSARVGEPTRTCTPSSSPSERCQGSSDKAQTQQLDCSADRASGANIYRTTAASFGFGSHAPRFAPGPTERDPTPSVAGPGAYEQMDRTIFSGASDCGQHRGATRFTYGEPPPINAETRVSAAQMACVQSTPLPSWPTHACPCPARAVAILQTVLSPRACLCRHVIPFEDEARGLEFIDRVHKHSDGWLRSDYNRFLLAADKRSEYLQYRYLQECAQQQIATDRSQYQEQGREVAAAVGQQRVVTSEQVVAMRRHRAEGRQTMKREADDRERKLQVRAAAWKEYSSACVSEVKGVSEDARRAREDIEAARAQSASVMREKLRRAEVARCAERDERVRQMRTTHKAARNSRPSHDLEDRSPPGGAFQPLTQAAKEAVDEAAAAAAAARTRAKERARFARLQDEKRKADANKDRRELKNLTQIVREQAQARVLEATEKARLKAAQLEAVAADAAAAEAAAVRAAEETAAKAAAVVEAAAAAAAAEAEEQRRIAKERRAKAQQQKRFGQNVGSKRGTRRNTCVSLEAQELQIADAAQESIAPAPASMISSSATQQPDAADESERALPTTACVSPDLVSPTEALPDHALAIATESSISSWMKAYS